MPVIYMWAPTPVRSPRTGTHIGPGDGPDSQPPARENLPRLSLTIAWAVPGHLTGRESLRGEALGMMFGCAVPLGESSLPSRAVGWTMPLDPLHSQEVAEGCSRNNFWLFPCCKQGKGSGVLLISEFCDENFGSAL